MAVDSGLGGRSRRTRWRLPRVEPAEVLHAARAIAEDLKGGLGGRGARHAAKGVLRLLDAEGIGLADLSGTVLWAGHPPAEVDIDALVHNVLHTETASGRPPALALPLHAHDELAGVLVVIGRPDRAAVREVASWIVDALERGRLEASAVNAARAELRALRAEISPHFVYNALTVIASLVRSEPDRSRELMLDFADYIRYSLARHGEYTTLADEFHAIETYLALQRAVLGERLTVQVRVAPEVLAVAVPYLALQPVVENAVRHGIEPSPGRGVVNVSGVAEGTDCVISVEDDGVGMDPAKAEAILAGQGDPGSVGLANVDKRLRSVYGSWYGLVVETAEGAGTRVVLRVPRFQPGVMP